MKKNILPIIIIVTTIILTASGLELSSIKAEGFQRNDFNKANLVKADSNNFDENINSDGNVPEHYVLMQNYPNPFNPTTTINYALPAEKYISLTIYNSLGNQIKTLVDETQSAGFHRVIFNGDNLSSGVYYAQLKAGNFVKVIKMILVK